MEGLKWWVCKRLSYCDTCIWLVAWGDTNDKSIGGYCHTSSNARKLKFVWLKLWTLRIGIQDTFLLMLDARWEVICTLAIMVDSWNLTHNILQVWTIKMGGSWYTSNHARELKFGTQYHSSMNFKDGKFLSHF